MAGHSKWANIQHRKNRQDERRGKLFTRLIREVSIAARTGGKDVSANPRLRLALDKASEANIPKDTLQRAIQKGVGELPGAHYEPVQYEGYGPKGTAIIVECLTDNKIRTVAEVRHAFSKHAGKLGTDGCVAYLFQQVGLFLFEPGASADALMAAAIDAGADNVEQDEEGGLEVSCSPGIFHEVQLRLEHAGFKAYIAEMAMRPDVFVQLSGAEAQSAQKLIDALENLDDVQQVHTNVTPSEFD